MCTRAAVYAPRLSTLRSAGKEAEKGGKLKGGSRTKVSYGGSNFDSGTPPPSPPFDRRAWRIHGGAAPATHVRRILRSGLMNDAIVRARSFLLADRRDVIFKYGFGLLVCDRTFLTAWKINDARICKDVSKEGRVGRGIGKLETLSFVRRLAIWEIKRGRFSESWTKGNPHLSALLVA